VQLIGPLYQGSELFSDPVIFIDGGTQFRHADEGLAVGDGDSYDGTLDEKLNRDKDYSDLSYVLFSLPAHFNDVLLHGFLGGQRDHEWANLGEINAFLSQRHQATQLHLGSSITGFTAGRWQLEIDEAFSLLCLTRSKITLVGECRYQLKQKTQLEPLCSHGISNLGHGRISLQSDEPIFIVYPERE
jgi:thiamine pyrophosphokinase